MAEITKAQTTQDILDKVGGKLDIAITDTSTPNVSQVIGWLNDAALMLVRLLPEDRLGLLMTTMSEEEVSSSLTITEPYERVISARKFGVECTRLKHREMDLMSTRTPLMSTTRNPAYCISGDGGNVQLRFWPESPGPVIVKAIRKPEAYGAAVLVDDLLVEWTPGPYTLPAEIELLAVDYAVMMGKIQDEEIQQAQVLMQAWYQQAGIEGQIEGLGVQS